MQLYPRAAVIGGGDVVFFWCSAQQSGGRPCCSAVRCLSDVRSASVRPAVHAPPRSHGPSSSLDVVGRVRRCGDWSDTAEAKRAMFPCGAQPRAVALVLRCGAVTVVSGYPLGCLRHRAPLWGERLWDTTASAGADTLRRAGYCPRREQAEAQCRCGESDSARVSVVPHCGVHFGE